MSRLLKSYLTSISTEHLIRIQPIVNLSEHLPAQVGNPEETLLLAQQKAEQLIADAEESARRTMEEASFSAQNLLDNAKSRAEQMLEQAKSEGFEAGYAEGRSQGISEAQQVIQSASELMEAVKSERLQLIAQAEPFVKDLALAAAEKIVRAELLLQPDALDRIIKSCLSEFHDQYLIEIRVHPDDYRLAAAHKEEYTSCVSGRSEIVVIPDARISRGGCYVFTDQGSIDARVETSLDEIRSVLREVPGVQRS